MPHRQAVGWIKERKEMKMKKIAKKMVKTISKSWHEANELMAKGAIYSL